MTSKQLNIRASSVAKLMTDPQSKADRESGLLSKTAMGHLCDLAVQHVYGVEFVLDNKYLRKGIACEQDSIDLYNTVFGTSLVKNSERRTRDGLTGEPDLILINDEIRNGVDIKTAWSLQTFPAFVHQIDGKGYEWQARAYMALFDCDTWTIAYCLVDTPGDLITWIDDAELPLHKGFDERYWPEQRITCLTYTRDVEKESLMFSRIHRGLEELDKLVKELEKK